MRACSVKVRRVGRPAGVWWAIAAIAAGTLATALSGALGAAHAAGQMHAGPALIAAYLVFLRRDVAGG